MADNSPLGRLAPGRRREAVRHGPAEQPGAQRSSSTRSSRPPTSSASTTTWARRPSRTCWRCASPTPCSSRSGTATTSTPCRSPWPRTSASARRAGFYEQTGAARDVLQNHLLQLLALTAMDEPVSFDAASLRTEKRKVLGAITAAQGPRPLRRPRPVRPGLAGRRAGQGLPRRGGRRPGVDHRDLRGRPARRRHPPLGRCPVLPAHRQAPPPPGHRDRRGVQEGPAPAVQQERHRGARLQPARRAGAARRGRDPAVRLQGARARRWRSATSPWTSSTARRSPRAAPRPTSGCCSTSLLGDAALFPQNEEVEESWRVIDPIEQLWAEQAAATGTAGCTSTGPASGGPAAADEMLAARRPRVAPAVSRSRSPRPTGERPT